MRHPKRYNWIGWLLVIVLIVSYQPLSDSIDTQRLVLGVKRPMALTKIVEFDPTAITGVIAGAILGGFREMAASMLWLKLDTMWHSGKVHWFEGLHVMRTVTLLDPHWLEPWRVTGWHLAYNLYVETDDPDHRALLLEKGISALKEGISWNPDRYELYFELGWTYYDKLDDFEEATKWFRYCLQFEHPEYIERLIAHAYERLPDIPKALDWYDYCLKRRPSDRTAKGATLTIRERYLPAWQLMEAGRYDEAIAEVNKYLTVEPKNRIALHLKAHIYEQAGNLAKALDMWKLAAETAALDDLARRKVADISAQLGRPVPHTPTYILQQRAPQQMAPTFRR